MRKLRSVATFRAVAIVAVIVILLSAVRAWRARAQTALDNSLNVPILVSPSVQPGKDQSLLFKATNISGTSVGVKLTLLNDADGKELEAVEFEKIPPRTTITRLYTPLGGTLVLNGTTFDAPAAVRALVGPLAGGEPAALRRVVASLQMVTIKPAAAKGPMPPLDAPMFVPLERCLFKPRGMYPYTGARYIWDCSPTM
jgi:hypothetical protein